MEDDKNSVKLLLEDNLIPGIPCAVTLNRITPKLSWRDMYTLSSVSRAWNYAVRSRQVYKERLLARSAATFIVYVNRVDGILLYSVGESSWYKLPPLPDVSGDGDGARIPPGSRCISVNGKIYVLGGQINSEAGNGVFVFDVASGGKWEQCASMKEPREHFACVVKDGRIYVFGGQPFDDTAENGLVRSQGGTVRCERRELQCRGEVYDPEENAWSYIKPMEFSREVQVYDHEENILSSIDSESCRYGNSSTIVGEEIFVDIESPFLAAYHPGKDEWRTVEYDFSCSSQSVRFNAQGKFHRARRQRVGRGSIFSWLWENESYDSFDKSWTHCRTFSFEGLLPAGCERIAPRCIFHVEDELLAILGWHKSGELGIGIPWAKRCLVQSRGFGSENKEISWELIDFNFQTLSDGLFRIDESATYFIFKL